MARIAALAPPRARSATPLLIALALIVAAVVLAQMLPALLWKFPEAWNLGLRGRIDVIQNWVIQNRGTHPLFIYGLDVLSNFIDSGVRALEDLLIALPWTLIVGLFAALGWLARGRGLALGCAAVFAGYMAFGLWEPAMQTLALMLFSVLVALAIGVLIGIISALNDRFAAVLQPVLDTMQTMPTFVYLIPVVLLFGIARVPAIVATVIYAVPPVIRLTNLGIRGVQPAAVEAGRSFGSTRNQLLTKVQLPLALNALLAGVNQTIMMALGMVVIAAMVGAGGLGRTVYLALQRQQVGLAFEAGAAIVLLAIVLDRLSDALGRIDLAIPRSQSETQARHRRTLIGLGVIAALASAGALVMPAGLPEALTVSIADPLDAAVRIFRNNVYFLTGWISDMLTIHVMSPLRDLFQSLPWIVVSAIVAAAAWLVSRRWRLALGCALGMFTIGLLGMWTLSMDTLSQVLVTTLITVLIAVPIGVLTSQSTIAQGVMRPVLDFLQTVPTFVYLVPVIMLFNVGRVPGLIASVLYAIPVGIKLTELGMRQVSPEAVEAARAFGSTRAQTIFKVQLPLARATIALSINQMIMMVLAMVIISGLVGGAGLGLEAVTGLAKVQVGRGMEAGLAIVIIAIILDRVTQAWAAGQRNGS